ncbi:MAG: right-handed parallel beta-helix repeat-containing protein [Phycisphaeraceae bacterium]|nr:right-handed parallel beta-helix repeat-containing protein [Phycisphaeraceae bacterium]
MAIRARLVRWWKSSARKFLATSAGDQDAPGPRLEMLEPRVLLSGTAYVIDSLLDVVADDGYLTLREAIEAANTNAAVNEAAAGSGSATDSITFAPSLFAGGHVDLILAGTELSIIGDLSITGPGQELLSIDAAGLSRVLVIWGSGVDATLAGLTITGGYINGDGGGIHSSGGSHVTLAHCAISYNYAIWDGGGGCVGGGSTMTLTDCTISANQAQSDGGGIYVYEEGVATLINCMVNGNAVQGGYGGGVCLKKNGAVTLTNSTVSENSAKYGGGLSMVEDTTTTLTLTNSTVSGNSANGVGEGGGLYVDGGMAMLTNCLINDNLARYWGGGMYIIDSEVMLANITATGNSAGASGGGLIVWGGSVVTMDVSTISGNSAGSGGGLSIHGGDVAIADGTISENTGQYGGGLYVAGAVTLTNTLISGNSAVSSDYPDGCGGGLYVVVGTATLVNSLVTSNSADNGGGGLYVTGGTAILTDTMVSGNSADYSGGGLVVTYNGTLTGTLTLTNCTISGNSAGAGGGLYVVDTATLNNTIVALNAADSDPDIFGPYTASSSFIGGDPKFIDNPTAGLDGIWGTGDDDLGDLHLRVDSSCVDAGNNALAVDADGNPLTIDLDGRPRMAGAQVDIGAYELGGIPGDFNGDGALTLSDINPFKLALSDTAAWQAQYPGVPLWAIDPNGDGVLTLSDINPFKALLTAGSGQSLSVAEGQGAGSQSLIRAGLGEPGPGTQCPALTITSSQSPAPGSPATQSPALLIQGKQYSSTPLRSWLVEAQWPSVIDSSWRSARGNGKSLFTQRRSIFGDVDASVAQPPAPVEAGLLAELPAVGA